MIWQYLLKAKQQTDMKLDFQWTVTSHSRMILIWPHSLLTVACSVFTANFMRMIIIRLIQCHPRTSVAKPKLIFKQGPLDFSYGANEEDGKPLMKA